MANKLPKPIAKATKSHSKMPMHKDMPKGMPMHKPGEMPMRKMGRGGGKRRGY